jgi:hypothetical protein
MKAPNFLESTTDELSRAMASISKQVKDEEGSQLDGELTKLIITGHRIASSESLNAACIEGIHAAVYTLRQASPQLDDLLGVHIGSLIQTRGPVPHSVNLRVPEEIETLDKGSKRIEILILRAVHRWRRMRVDCRKAREENMSYRVILDLLDGQLAESTQGKGSSTEEEVYSD